jgi:hypothetical protein
MVDAVQYMAMSRGVLMALTGTACASTGRGRVRWYVIAR